MPLSTDRAGIALSISGARFVGGGGSVTVTRKLCDAVLPPGSRAVTVTSARPFATPLTDTVEPFTETVATAVAEDFTVYVSASPSGSLKCEDTRTDTVLPLSTDRAGIALSTLGARFVGGGGSVTVTLNCCSASSPPGSRAVTVIVASPTAMPLNATRLPVTETVVTPVFDEAAL